MQNALRTQQEIFSNDSNLSSLEASRLAVIAYAEAGLTISPTKIDFFKQRVGRRLRALDMSQYGDYIRFVETPNGKSERRMLVEALTTHTTNFFRENRHYDFLMSEGLPALVANGGGRERTMTIWSSACSHGAELYSAMMVCQEYTERSGTMISVQGVGTDISRQIVKRAEHAVYNRDEISGLSETRRKQFLLKARNGEPRFRIEPELRRKCKWMLSNITETSPAGPPEADIIFLRNILIYFDQETQDRVVNVMASRLRPGGYLLTGHSEALGAPPSSLTQVHASTYQKDAF